MNFNFENEISSVLKNCTRILISITCVYDHVKYKEKYIDLLQVQILVYIYISILLTLSSRLCTNRHLFKKITCAQIDTVIKLEEVHKYASTIKASNAQIDTQIPNCLYNI